MPAEIEGEHDGPRFGRQSGSQLRVPVARRSRFLAHFGEPVRQDNAVATGAGSGREVGPGQIAGESGPTG